MHEVESEMFKDVFNILISIVMNSKFKMYQKSLKCILQPQRLFGTYDSFYIKYSLSGEYYIKYLKWS